MTQHPHAGKYILLGAVGLTVVIAIALVAFGLPDAVQDLPATMSLPMIFVYSLFALPGIITAAGVFYGIVLSNRRENQRIEREDARERRVTSQLAEAAQILAAKTEASRVDTIEAAQQVVSTLVAHAEDEKVTADGLRERLEEVHGCLDAKLATIAMQTKRKGAGQ